MNMDKPVDIIMWVGEEHYTVSSFIDEAERMGVSKRIPRTAIPEGIVPGQSRILIKHRQAILHSRYDLLDELLLELSYVHDMPKYSLPNDMLKVVMFLEGLEETELQTWTTLIDAFGITWFPGVIGYSYITSIQYIAYEDEEELPEDLQHLEGYVEPVKIKYEEINET